MKVQRGLGAVEAVTIDKPSGEVFELVEKARAVVRAVREGTPVPCSGEDGAWSTLTCLRAAESLDRGEVVRIRTWAQ